MQPIEIFRTGRHTTMSGEGIAFSAADLAQTVAAYDPQRHEAPIVIGHPATDAPAYGWVADITFDGERLAASPRQVDPGFADLVAAGRYKKVSAAFYRPDGPGNPVPGTWYLRHVGFLGAQAPAVKGLAPVSFASAGGIAYFGEAAGPDGFDRRDADAIRRAAHVFMAEEASIGRHVGWAEAVDQVMRMPAAVAFAEPGRFDANDGHSIARAALKFQRNESAIGRAVNMAEAVDTIMRQPAVLFAEADGFDPLDSDAIARAALRHQAVEEQRGHPTTIDVAVAHVVRHNPRKAS